ncbi:sensor histidine kinase [Xanthobacter tagetidis]|uniref:histidine kinase n=1 Tax=Xanthobacter tagetidis TaxID=60216 RepID=A0A3L7AJ93_9HYPH|nr:sensor histidine kinase KdpD [Xanthobacter tagetidis]MBB6306416.1 two-component system sensor histidine kinase KdpD [Xanthobacter tagetidis]RLP79671.1 sensor histidine kinase KdpD [Xanthobacter tagetidis]
MPPTPEERPAPEAFLEAARTEDRGRGGPGRLKVFLGASPGVGKTFAMLEEARARQLAGVDVVVALVETHGRAETAALLRTLEQLPRRAVDYRGQSLSELDLDALLARRPTLALIDELAHTNAPGSRHPKRWQDVLEVLDAGIDVTTTLNIQHIESLNDIVSRITGVRVAETVPDHVLQRADDIELIDLPPEELIKRLKDGKVYVPQQVGRALENFFSKGNLTALRELALRTAASRVDAEMLAYMRANAVPGPWPTEERLLVCVNEAPVAKALVRAGRRMADRARIPWIVATVLTPRHETLPPQARAATKEALRLAETLGAESVTLHADSDAVAELLRFARSRNVTRVVIGRPRTHGTWWRKLAGLLREPVADRLLDAATDFEVTVVTAHGPPDRPGRARWPAVRPEWRGYVAAAGAIALASLIAWPIGVWDAIPGGAISAIYLTAVLVVGANFGLGASLVATALGSMAYNFLYTAPYYTLAVSSPEDVVSILVFLVGAVFTGTLAGRLKAQVESVRAAQRRTETLYDFARKIASAGNADDVLWAGAYHIAATLDCRSLILMPAPSGALEQVQGHPSIEDLDARAEGAARWAFERNEPAGSGTATLPMSEWLFVPLAAGERPLGVIGVRFRDRTRSLDPETRRLLLAVEDQVAVAVERVRLGEELADARVSAESERLRGALLNSVSHDLRTPLATVIGALSSLAEDADGLDAEDRRALLGTALDEARRLDRYVQNLLDMTRLGHGVLRPKRAPVELAEIVGRVRADLARILAGHRLETAIPRTLPMLDVDPVLIGQALTNVIENAAKYAPPGTAITITARAEGPDALVFVSDAGPGIPGTEREKVFDLFHRVTQGDARPAGTGLGLAIVRGLVEAHGGSASAQEGPGGQGATIVLRLPLAAAPIDDGT